MAEQRRTLTGTRGPPPVIGGLVFLAAGLTFAFIGFREIAIAAQYYAHGHEVEATVLVKQLRHATPTTSTVLRITYRVAVDGLPAVDRTEAVAVALWDRAVIGEPLRARYLPGAPDSVHLLPAPSVLPFVVLAAIGSLVCALGAALVVSGFRATLPQMGIEKSREERRR
jgi:Protein of unknown function (DUF3592)